MTKESRLPGLWLRQLAERVFDRERLERVVLPALADLQHECGDSAAFRGSPARVLGCLEGDGDLRAR